MKPLLLRLDDKTHAKLKTISKKEERTVTDLIREAIRIIWIRKAA